MQYAIIIIFIAVIAFAAIKKVNVFSSFARGAGEAADFVLRLLPILAGTYIMCELFEASGLSKALTNVLSPAVELIGVPPALTKLMLLKPLSGSGSLTYLAKILKEYGADSYTARCACVLYGSSDTVFYICAIYFASCKKKRRKLPVAICLFSAFVSAIAAILICRAM